MRLVRWATVSADAELDEFSTPLDRGMRRLEGDEADAARRMLAETQAAVQPALEEADRCRRRAFGLLG